jgi:hypothetical protein
MRLRVFAAIALTVASVENVPFVFAQTPPTATEAFDLRIRCKVMADKKANDLSWHPLSVADGVAGGMSADAVAALNKSTMPKVLGSWQTSRYDAKNNRCYIQIYSHTQRASFDSEFRQVYDAQTDDLLAFAEIKNGTKNGMVFDKYKGPPVPHCFSTPGCVPGLGWDAAIAYMDEMMADKPN